MRERVGVKGERVKDLVEPSLFSFVVWENELNHNSRKA